jgi:pimeloyl-ACP methyl ester carboxylesterase
VSSKLGFKLLCALMLSSISMLTAANEANERFKGFYDSEWGQTQTCRETALNKFGVCSNVLRNEGNAPFILHNKNSDRVAVLIHGLSDSPFFMRAIAKILFDEGYSVVVPLLPGHGLREADDDMSDWDLAERWQSHVDDVIGLASTMGNTLVVGGFSTGGALAVDNYLTKDNHIDGIMLFSGALALSDNAEGMSRIWGIKLLAKIVDGTYETHGPNPYKYPNVAGFAGLELMDIINDIRAVTGATNGTNGDNGSDNKSAGAQKHIDIPLFAAHSQADSTTPIYGVENLIAQSKGANTFFVIDETYKLCHADLVVNSELLAKMNFNANMVNQQEECAMPKANPLFSTMKLMLVDYLTQFK